MTGTQTEGWGVEYRREGDHTPDATAVRGPSTLEHEPWTREVAEAAAAQMRKEGGYCHVKVVPLAKTSDAG